MANTNIINAVFGSGACAVTTSAFRANYGMVLRFSGIDLPTAFEVDFSNYDVMGRDSITAIGQNNEVQIPDDLWDSGLNIYAFVYLHPTDDSGVTVYTVTIPVLGRPNRTEETPTPHEQSVIEQAISALNDAVEQTAADVETTAANAQAAAQSEANASVSERASAASASAALASQNAAESASRSATESASGAAESARNAANSASAAAESATNAQESAEQAERSVQSIGDDVERAEQAAQTATEKATEASGSASTASVKANEAAQSAQSAASAAQNAAASEQLAESHATDAEQAKLDAQDAKEAAETAQAAAEQAAESISDKAAQIEHNTADIADLVQSKAGVLIDTVTGSIASFVPDSTIPTIEGLTVDIEPAQDLHGYDAPWPAGGTKNKMPNAIPKTETINGVTFKLDDFGVFTVTGTATAKANCDFPIGYSFVILDGDPKPKFALNNTQSTSATFRFFNNSVQIDSWGITPSYRTAEYSDMRGRTCNSYRITVPSGAVVNMTISPMIVENSVTDYTYIPYSNICPISGWDGVKVTRTGKNLIRVKTADRTTAGITFTVREDGSVIANGTATGTAWLTARVTDRNLMTFLKAGTYTVSGGKSPNLVCYLGGNYVDGSDLPGYYDKGTGVTFTITQDAFVYPQIQVYAGQTCDNIVFNFQLELGSTATDYEPYSGQTYDITLPSEAGTVYGGTLDVTTGVLTVDRAMVDLGSMVWSYNTTYAFFTSNSISTRKIGVLNVWSDLFKTMGGSWSGTPVQNALWGNGSNATLYVQTPPLDNVNDFMALVDGHQLMYELATPITIDLTPLEISVLTGQTNNIWADSGDVSVDYAADLKTYINNKIAAAVAALS